MHRRSFLLGLLAMPAVGAAVAANTVLSFEHTAQAATQPTLAAHHLDALINTVDSPTHIITHRETIIQLLSADNELLKTLPWRESL